MKWMKWMVLASFAALIVGGCTPGKTYERRLKRELASGIRYDSLFMGLSFGMTQKEFYEHCWDMNKDSIIKQGSANMSVQYDLNEELEHPATMNFYPKFDSGKIVEMPVRFIYNGWAPWTKELSASNLALDVKNWYEDIYGKGFITVTHPMNGDAYTKIDGNRRITIYVENDLYVWARFTDMLAGLEKDSLSANQN
ncbi:MAG: hypothetical protein DRI97_17170 [Bacteroidetes bacterium]|nr:MAG: hypothetical protein DRI97_17170 [Bacteroidota bacterium]RLD68715.1 MAG: hypothetical protein DRI98_11485 [Bacteroidota bacterium]RLD94798.1 MAG: hypothetical protein DRJ29_04765 [Bacteroidota bacterium]